MDSCCDCDCDCIFAPDPDFDINKHVTFVTVDGVTYIYGNLRVRRTFSNRSPSGTLLGYVQNGRAVWY